MSLTTASTNLVAALQTVQDLIQAFVQNQDLSIETPTSVRRNAALDNPVHGIGSTDVINTTNSLIENDPGEINDTNIVTLTKAIPLLGSDSLKNNDGFIEAIVLPSGSSANNASSNLQNLTTDQRRDDFSRLIDGGGDIGTFETDLLLSAIVVDTLVDENDGNFDPGDRSLREALIRIADGGTITFDSSLINGTITLQASLGQLVVDKTVTIDGDNKAIIIDAAEGSRVFIINDGDNDQTSEVVLSGLTITGGKIAGNGAGISSVENLTIENSIISGNRSIGIVGTYENYDGGGIDSRNANLTILNSQITNNQVIGQEDDDDDADGGGISIRDGQLMIVGSNISQNQVMGGATDGGGIYSMNADVNVMNSTISGNTVTGVNLGSGGGIYNRYGDTTVTQSTIADNSTIMTGSFGSGDGGGIFSRNGDLTVSDSTISGNSAAGIDRTDGGGIYSRGGDLMISNSTISGNSTTGIGADGGGIFFGNGIATISNATLIDNSADARGGGLFISSGTVALTSSLISGNTATDLGNEINNRGTFTSIAQNLLGDISQTYDQALIGISTLEASNIIATANTNGNGTHLPTALSNILNPNLADNGGISPTHALTINSPAIDAGSNPQNLTTDQRGSGFSREIDGDSNGTAITDIGAFEFRPASIQVTLPDNSLANGMNDITFTTPLSLFRDGVEDNDLVRPNFADTLQFINITNLGDQLLSISGIDINPNAIGVGIAPEGDFLLNPGETERVNLTYTPLAAGEAFDLSDALVINSNADNNAAFEVHLAGQSTFNSDINYDGIVNLTELGLLNANFGFMNGDSDYDPTADIDGNGHN